jgi:thiol-disulfide isomerase/thioredoxin
LLSPVMVNQRAPERLAELPELSLEQLSGETAQLQNFLGKPIVMNLWATWCGPCRRELPMFSSMAAQHPNISFLFIDQGENAQQVKSYLAERELVLEHVLLDKRSQLGEAFRSLGLPTTLFFDDQGRLIDTHIGEISSVALFNTLGDLRP